MTNNETWFFRDANCFAALTGIVLPEMIKRRAQRTQARHLERGLFQRPGTLQHRHGDSRAIQSCRGWKLLHPGH